MIFFWVVLFDDFSEVLVDFAFFVTPDDFDDGGVLRSGASVEVVDCSDRSFPHPPVRRIVTNDKLAAILGSCVMFVKLIYLIGNHVSTQEKFLLVLVEKYSHSQILKSCDRASLKIPNLSLHLL